MRSLKHPLVLLLLVASLHGEWTINRLWSRLPPRTFKERRVHDLALVMSESGKRQVERLAETIPLFDLYFLTVDKIHGEVYQKHGDNAIEYVVNEMLEGSMKTQEQRDRSFVIFYATDDRRFLWRTGSVARQYVDDQTCVKFSDEIKPFLRNQDFDGAFLKAVKRIRKHLKANNLLIQDDERPELGSRKLLMVVAILVLFFWCVARGRKAAMAGRDQAEYKRDDGIQGIPRRNPQEQSGYPQGPNPANPYAPNFGSEGSFRYPNLDDEPGDPIGHCGHPYQPGYPQTRNQPRQTLPEDIPLQHQHFQSDLRGNSAINPGASLGMGNLIGRAVTGQVINHLMSNREEERKEPRIYRRKSTRWPSGDSRENSESESKPEKKSKQVYGGAAGNWAKTDPKEQSTWSKWLGNAEKETTKTSEKFKFNEPESPRTTTPVASGGAKGGW